MENKQGKYRAYTSRSLLPHVVSFDSLLLFHVSLSPSTSLCLFSSRPWSNGLKLILCEIPWPYRKFRQAVQRTNEQQSCAPVHRSLQMAGFLLSFILFLFLRSRIIRANQINSNARSLFVISGERSHQNSLICDHRFKFSERRLRFKGGKESRKGCIDYTTIFSAHANMRRVCSTDNNAIYQLWKRIGNQCT